MSSTLFTLARRVNPPKVEGGKLPLPECPVAPRRLPLTKGQIIFPAVIIVAVLAMVAMVFANRSMRSGQMGYMSMMFPVMILFSVGGMFMQGRHQGGDNKALSPAQLEETRRSYLAELDETREEAQGDAANQFANFAYHYPEPALLRGLVGSTRMWERSITHDEMGLHRLFIRFGVGTADLAKELKPAALGDSIDYEPVCYSALSAFLTEQSRIDGIAKPLSLPIHPLIKIVADPDAAENALALVRAVICQAACFHSPQDLKIMVVTDNVVRWDWVKWLPHTQHDDRQDAGGTARMIWTSSAEMERVVGNELGPQGRKNFGQATDVRPHWLVINDQKQPDSEWDAICRRGVGGVAGVTFMRMEDNR